MICKVEICVMMTEIWTIEGGQKDVSSLRGIKKKKKKMKEPNKLLKLKLKLFSIVTLNVQTTAHLLSRNFHNLLPLKI